MVDNELFSRVSFSDRLARGFGQALGYLALSAPFVSYYLVSAGVVLALWNGICAKTFNQPSLRLTDTLVVVLALRLLGHLLRGERVPFTRKTSGKGNNYE